MTIFSKIAQKHPVLTTEKITLSNRLYSGYYEITPAFAQEVLENRNGRNRKSIYDNVEKIVDDINEGRFEANGEAIIFNCEGGLNDGGNRLKAVLQTGKSIISNVSFGTTPESMATIDQGKARTTAHILQMYGLKYGTILSAIAKSLYAYEKGDGSNAGRCSSISIQRSVAIALDRPELSKIAAWAVSLRRDVAGIVTPTELGVARAILEKKIGSESVYFLERVAIGDCLNSADAAFQVRKRLLSSKVRMGRTAKLEILFRGAISHMEGKPVSRIMTTGKFPTFPRVKQKSTAKAIEARQGGGADAVHESAVRQDLPEEI